MSTQTSSGNRNVLACATRLAFALACVFAFTAPTSADEATWIGPPTAAPHGNAHSSGVLAHSYKYHRQTPAASQTITPAGGWYGYGFPVKTHRWGWFGAAHYHPTVLWHRGYNGDAVRWSYRSGY